MRYWLEQEDDRGDLLQLQVKQLTAASAPQAFEEVRQRICAARPLVMDMRQLDFIDSSAIGELVLLARQFRTRAAAFVISGLSPPLMGLVEMMRLNQVMDFSPDVDGAFAKMATDTSGADSHHGR
ncbi:STAS domain-containing protein [Marichromatium gracile]|uniref:STAS domain-containing protein n=1 Tax=Marichromatium gracile TaxID=1048 RepID=UPI001F2555FA|nr:STAS domain-containing protein [Marichromatium gracile]MCF1183262.1 STAS domain-containing protein [Marichromatium gracile]